MIRKVNQTKKIVTENDAALVTDLRKLVRIYGNDAVASAARNITKPNKRRALERKDYLLLVPYIRIEAILSLDGKPRTSHPAIAEMFYNEHGGQGRDSVIRRICKRLASRSAKLHKHVLMIEISENDYPVELYVKTCYLCLKIDGLEDYAAILLDSIKAEIGRLVDSGVAVNRKLSAKQIKEMSEGLSNTNALAGWKGLLNPPRD